MKLTHVPLLLIAVLFFGSEALPAPKAPRRTVPRRTTAPRATPPTPQLVLQLGHEGAVKSTAFAPDGTHIATGGSDGTVRLWDAHTGALVGAWQTHQGDVASLQFSPRGGMIASAGYDGKVIVRDYAGKVRVTLNARGPVSFSPDGATLLAGIPNKQFPGAYSQPALWDAVTGRLNLALDFSDFDVAAFSPDGQTLATSSRNSIYLWDTSSGRRRRVIKAEPTYTIPTLAFSPDGKIIASGGEIVRLFEAVSGEPLRNLTANLGSVRMVEFLPDGRLLTVADDAARLWNSQTWERERTIPIPEKGFGALALSQDRRTLLATGGGLRFLDLSGGEWRILPRQTAQHDEPHNLYFSPDGKTLALTLGRGAEEVPSPPVLLPVAGKPAPGESSRGEIWLWKPSSIKPARVLPVENNIFHAVPLNGGKTLYCEANFALTRYDVASGARRSFGDWENGVSMVAVSPNGAVAAAAYFTRALRLFDARSGKHLRTIQTVKDPENEQEDWSWLVFSPDSKTLATASFDGTVRLWNAASGRLQKKWKLGDEPGEIVYSPDARLLAAAGASGAVWLWSVDGKSAPRALKGHVGQVACVAISPDGKTLASGGEDGTVRVWDVASGKSKRLLKPDAGGINAVRFTPRGVLLCATAGGQVQAWDALAGRLRLTWRPLPGPSNWVAWTPAGSYDAAPGAAPYLRWRQGSQWLSQLPQMHRPEIIAPAWGF